MRRFDVILIVVTYGLAACSLYKPREDVSPPVAVPAGFSDSGDARATPERWWKDFDDAELDRLVDSVLSRNLDLRAAWARLDQAEASARKGRAGMWPQIDAEASASRAKSLFFAGERLGEQGFRSERLLLTAAATYEVDLWKRIWSLKKAGEIDVYASRGDLETMAMTLAAEITNAWIGLIEQQAQRDLLARQVEVGERFLRLTELRFSQGVASALDVYQQRQQLASTRAQIPLAEARIEELGTRIAVLRGMPPSGRIVATSTALPEVPPLPSTGIPADLLVRRPDVRAAALRVTASDHRVAAAVADRLPAIRLTARGSFESFSPPERLFDASLWTLAGNLAAPVFDAGRRQAEVDRTKAVVAERLYQYGQVFIEAVKEVEDALVLERRQREHLAELRQNLGFSKRALEEARTRYVGGLSDYLPVLAALETLQQVERSELGARRDLLSFRIRLYRSLGGSWANGLERETRVSAVSGMTERR